MIAEKEKAQLIVEVMQRFAPHMDDSTDLFQKMGGMISNFGQMVESFSDLPEDKKAAFIDFIRLFNNYIEHAGANFNNLRDFYSYMTQTTNTLIHQYKLAIGVE